MNRQDIRIIESVWEVLKNKFNATVHNCFYQIYSMPMFYENYDIDEVIYIIEKVKEGKILND